MELLISAILAFISDHVFSLYQRHVISSAQAQGVLNAAAKCAEEVTPQNIAIVDPSGLLVAFLRMDNAYPGSIDLSIKKARTTVLFNGLPSGVVYDLAQPGAPFYGKYSETYSFDNLVLTAFKAYRRPMAVLSFSEAACPSTRTAFCWDLLVSQAEALIKTCKSHRLASTG